MVVGGTVILIVHIGRPYNFGLSWCVKMTRDVANIAFHSILMIDRHISTR